MVKRNHRWFDPEYKNALCTTITSLGTTASSNGYQDPRGSLQKSWLRLSPKLRKLVLNLGVIELLFRKCVQNLPTAPKIDTTEIDVGCKIKIVIGKGGETIDKIIAETGVKIDIDGIRRNVSIHTRATKMRLTVPKRSLLVCAWSRAWMKLHHAKAVRIEKFRCLCQSSLISTDALVHIPRLWRAPTVSKHFSDWRDEVDVKIIKIRKVVSCFYEGTLPRPPKPEQSEAVHENEPRLAVPSCHGRRMTG